MNDRSPSGCTITIVLEVPAVSLRRTPRVSAP
jgi:hypothetical protein